MQNDQIQLIHKQTDDWRIVHACHSHYLVNIVEEHFVFTVIGQIMQTIRIVNDESLAIQ